MSEERRCSRNTRPKSLVLGYLKENSQHHTRAEDIIEDLSQRGEHVGKTTVYRILKSLEAENQIRKYTLDEKSPACYQYVGKNTECLHHYHLMCYGCGELIHFNSKAMIGMEEEILKATGFAVDESKTVFYGLCEDCRTAGEGRN